MSLKHYILATAGHVDHGKSALVKALTGTDPDRLPQEKARGITIDLGFAHIELPSPEQHESSFLLGIIDVPGHEDFVKNMIAGVGSIDVALLAVAADDGWMPQTEEHLQILTYLGVSKVVVALTKIDLACDQTGAAAEIREKLQETVFADAPIVPTSVVDLRGLEDLRHSLVAVLSRTPAPGDIGKPRLPVDRVFSLRGIGTIVTGTLTDGTLRCGQTVVIQPSGKTARIRTIQSHNCDFESSGPGTRTALNLPDLTPGDIKRGNTITLEGLGEPSTVLDVRIEISGRANRMLKNGSRVRVHHGSGNVAASLTLNGKQTLAPGEQALARFRLEEATFVFAGDRFIVRDWAEQMTLAGGVVLQPEPGSQPFYAESWMEFLSARSKSDDVITFVASEVALAGAARRPQLLLKSRFSAAGISSAISELTRRGTATVIGDCVFDTARFRAWGAAAADAIDRHHRNHPEQGGLALCDLWKTLRSELSDRHWFDALVDGLCERDFVRAGALIGRKAHRPQLSTELQVAARKLRSALATTPFDPPSRKELTPDPVSQQALRFLIETGEAVEINREVVMTSESVRRAIDLIRRFIDEHGPATVSELRQSLNSSRRVMVPLLERLDRDGTTLRKNDRRTVRR